MEDRIMQHDNTGMRKRALVDGGVQGIIAEMIERDVTRDGRDFNPPVKPQCCEQRRRVIGHAGACWRQRRIESDSHCFLRLPNSAVPTLTQVAPSSMATSKSCDIPIESCGNPCCSAKRHRRRKYSREFSGSSDQ